MAVRARVELNRPAIRTLMTDPSSPVVLQLKRTGDTTTAVAKIGAPKRTGRLQSRISGGLHLQPARARYRITSAASYSQAVHWGRGPVVAKNARALRFRVGGNVIYAHSVGPAKGQPYLSQAARAVTGKRVRWRRGIPAL